MKRNMVRHLKNRHPYAFAKFGKMKKDPVTKIRYQAREIKAYPKRSIFWKLFEEVGKNIRCKICDKMLSKNMTRHLKTRHPKEYNQVASLMSSLNSEKTHIIARGWVKKYCIKVERGYKCDLCHKVLKMGHSYYHNMKRHIQTKHPYIYATEIKSAQVEEMFSVIPNDEEFLFKHRDSAKKKKNTVSVKEKKYSNDESSDDGDSVQSKHIREMHEKIQMLCVKEVPGKRQGSQINCFWNFFEDTEDDQIYACMFCKEEISIFPQNDANLRSHIRNEHPDINEIILKCILENEHSTNARNNDDSDNSEIAAEGSKPTDFEIVEDGLYKCKKCNILITCVENELALFNHIQEYHPQHDFKHGDSTLDEGQVIGGLIVTDESITAIGEIIIEDPLQNEE